MTKHTLNGIQSVNICMIQEVLVSFCKKLTENKPFYNSTFTVRADGQKLPALIIFKEENGIIPPRARDLLIIPENIIIKALTSSYITIEILKDYLLLNFKRTEKKLIIIDRCATHLGNE